MPASASHRRTKYKPSSAQPAAILEEAHALLKNRRFNDAIDLYEQLVSTPGLDAIPILAELFDVYQRIRSISSDRYTLYQSRIFDFGIAPSEKVLDVGSGHHPFPLATHLSDISATDDKYGRAGIPFKRIEGKPVYEFNIESIPLSDGEFDFTYCSHVLEHTRNPAAACEELMRISRRGYIETPTASKDLWLCNAKPANHTMSVELCDRDCLLFRPYTVEEIEGIGSDILCQMHVGPQTLREKAFSSLINLFPERINTMLYWERRFRYRIQRSELDPAPTTTSRTTTAQDSARLAVPGEAVQIGTEYGGWHVSASAHEGADTADGNNSSAAGFERKKGESGTLLRETPAILLLLHKRPSTTRRTLEAVRSARPSRLYISIDGPRADRAGESDSVRSVQEMFPREIDWPCVVDLRLSGINLGCRAHNSSAIDWFFENEDRGIVLEDDCVASPDFFPYCAELLERFAGDERIFSISGDNFQRGRTRGKGSYYFSEIQHCWGWATWRRAWKHYRTVEAELPSLLARYRRGDLPPFAQHPAVEAMWMENLRRVLDSEVDSWAYIWALTCLFRKGLTILPNRNLVKNIGFGPDATHTSTVGSDNAPAASRLDWPLVHPQTIATDRDADAFTYTSSFGVTFPPPPPPHSASAPALRQSLRFGLPTPVAFLLSERSAACRKVFQTIREARPEQLFLICDAPNPSHPAEAEGIAESRALANQIDWDCQVTIHFPDVRQGRSAMMIGGLDRVFGSVDRAIVLEDDGLPTPSFFRFCSELLGRYANDPSVGGIGGDILSTWGDSSNESYRFSRIPQLRGWATWARAWRLHDRWMEQWPAFASSSALEELWGDPEVVHYWKRIFTEYQAGRIEAWSPSWIFSCWKNGLFTILPKSKLVKDLDNDGEADIPVDALHFPLVHPARVSWDREIDLDSFRAGLGLGGRPAAKMETQPSVPTPGRYTPEPFLASMACEDPYDIAFGWGLTQPHLQELVRLCYKTPDQAYNAKAYEASEEFRETVRILAALGQGPNQGRKVLDFGCGNAIGAWAMVGAGYKATGIDSSPGNLAGLGAGLRLKGFEGRDFDLHISRGEFLPYPDATFDVVMMRQVLHHIVDLEGFLVEVHRILKPGGVACGLRDHVVWNESQRADFFRTHPFHHITKDENCHYLQEYVRAFESAGFGSVDVIDPRESIINTFPGPYRPGERLDVAQAKIRPTGNDIYSFFATKRT